MDETTDQGLSDTRLTENDKMPVAVRESPESATNLADCGVYAYELGIHHYRCGNSGLLSLYVHVGNQLEDEFEVS